MVEVSGLIGLVISLLLLFGFDHGGSYMWSTGVEREISINFYLIESWYVIPVIHGAAEEGIHR